MSANFTNIFPDATCQTLIDVYAHIQSESASWEGNERTFLPLPKVDGLVEIGTIAYDRPIWWGSYHDGPPKLGLRQFLEIVLPPLPEGRTPRVVDVGCGNSASCFDLVEKRGCEVIFVDYSIDSLNHLKREFSKKYPHLLNQVQFVCTPIEDYVWPEDVDLVIASDALPYFNPEKIPTIMKRIERALRPGGQFIGNFVSRTEVESPISFIYELTFRRSGGWYVKDEQSVKTLLTSEGYELQRCSSHNQHPTTIIFSAIKAAGADVRKMTSQIRRLRKLDPKPDNVGYWFYVAKCKLNRGNPYGAEALQQFEVVEKEIDKQSYDSQTKYGWTPLHVAVLATNRAFIAYLLSKQAKTNIPDKEEMTAIDYARRYNPGLLDLLTSG